MKSPRFHLALLALLSGAIFLANTWGYDLWAPDEPRFAEVAREMLDSGDYLVPRVNGLPYKEKPPLMFWLIAAVSVPFGDVNEFSARLPSALAGIVTVLLTYLLALRLHGRRVAVWSALVLMTSVLFWWQSRTAQIDMVLTACLTGTLYAFWRWQEERSPRWLIAFYGCIALAVYTKGPVGYLLPLFLVLAFYWRRGKERRGLHLFWGTLAVVVLILLWLIPARMGASAQTGQAADQAIAANLFRQTIGRFIFGVSKAQPPWYYLFRLPVNLLPWALFLPWVLPWVWQRRREGPAMRLVLSWTVPAFVFFSICVGKRELYLLPLFPALAILMARAILDLMDSDHVTWRKRTAWVWGGVLVAFGAAPLILRQSEHADLWSNSLVLFGLPALFFAAQTIYWTLRSPMRSLPALMAAHFGCVTVLAAFLVFPIVNTTKSARAFCEPVRLLAEKDPGLRLYSICFSREEYIFYSRHFHERNLNGLLTLDVPDDTDPDAIQQVQAVVRQGAINSVKDIRIQSFKDLTEEEYQRLKAAVHEVVEVNESVLVAAFRKALLAEVGAFADDFQGSEPIALFVQQRDWPWILPLHESLRPHTVLGHRQVGSRQVLLIANPAAAELLAQTPSS
jgi:4-amino-4-deoxy-L-arabinose transferase-like glycosyltransferase